MHRTSWRRVTKDHRKTFLGIAILAICFCFSPHLHGQSTAEAGKGEADHFIAAAEEKLLALKSKREQAAWVQATSITEETEALAAEAERDYIGAVRELSADSRKFDHRVLSFDTRRKIDLLRLEGDLPAPSDPGEQAELTQIAASLQSDYATAEYCPEEGTRCHSSTVLQLLMANVRNPVALKNIWIGWHNTARPLKQRFTRFVELANKGAREMGFADVGAMWRSKYDMPPSQFGQEMERLWQQVKPLYDSLYVYTRQQLNQRYGTNVVPEDGPIPAHLFGNMWAQEWNNIFPLLFSMEKSADRLDLTKILREKNIDEVAMVYAENFFISLGFEPLPKTFWERSMLKKPQDRDVDCGATAWNLDVSGDVRVSMCIEPTGDDFATVHHELGHLYYELAYRKQPMLYRNGANDGFHEAIGEAIDLSVTPEYLHKIGLIDKVPDARADVALLLNRALENVAFLPFGYLVDQWRWKVFSRRG